MIRAEIHLQGGQTIVASIPANQLPFHDPQDEQSVSQAVADHIERQLNMPTRPHWSWLGDAYVFSQAVSAVTHSTSTTSEASPSDERSL